MTATVVQALPEATRERVLRLADVLFAEHGYAAVSMREVALAAGVTKPALYYHFRDKEALYEECVLATQQRLGALLRVAAQQEGTLADRLAAVVVALLTGSSHHPVRTQADITEHLPLEARVRVSRSWTELVMGPVVALFETDKDGMREGVTAEQASSALFGAAYGAALVYLPFIEAARGPADGAEDGVPAPPGETAILIADLVLRGVGR